MVTSFLHYSDVTDRRAASVRLFVFLSIPRADIRVCEIIRFHHECEGGIKKNPFCGSPIGITRLVE